MAAALAIGVIGAGQVAERHVAAYRANPSTRVSVIIDPALERAQALEFVSSLLEGREPSVPAAAGRDSLEVALAIYRSAAEGTRVDLGDATRAGTGVAGAVGQGA